MSCDCSHVPLHHQKENQNQKKRNIKSRKIDKRNRKMLVSKYTITDTSCQGRNDSKQIMMFDSSLNKFSDYLAAQPLLKKNNI